MQRLRPAENRSQCFDGGPNDIVERLLPSQGRARVLSMSPEQQRPRVLGSVFLFHDSRPYSSGRSELCDLFKEVHSRVPEERQAWREFVHFQTSFDSEVNVCETICQRKR